MKKIYLLPFFLILLVIIFGTIVVKKNDAQAEVKENLKQVKAIEIEKGNFNETQEYSGLVKGVQETELAPKISGRIVNVYKKEGDLVKKGELLVTLDGSELFDQKNLSVQQLYNAQKSLEEAEDYYDQTVDQAKEELEIAKDVRDEAEDNGDSQEIFSAKKDVDRVEEAVKSAKKMRDLQQQLAQNQVSVSKNQLEIYSNSAENTRLLAPYSGVITKKYFDAGALVSPQSPIFSLADLSQKEVKITVPGTVVGKIALGDDVKIKSSNNKIFSGEIKAVSPVSDVVTRKSIVKIALKKESDLRAGELVSVELKISQKKEAIVIPLSAVKKDYYENSVFVLDGEIAKEKTVKLGDIENNQVEIKAGLQAGEKIIVEGQSYLKNNEKVRIYE